MKIIKTRGKLTKVQSNHNNLRTNEIEGWFYDLPTQGQRFAFFGQPLDKKATIRVIDTSPVTETMQVGSALEFKTLNSTYRLEIGEAVEVPEVQEGIVIRGGLH